jgi:hypothetical protein
MHHLGSRLAWYRLIDRSSGEPFETSQLLGSLREYLGNSPATKGPIEQLTGMFTSSMTTSVPTLFFQFQKNFLLQEDAQSRKVMAEPYMARVFKKIARESSHKLERLPFSSLVFFNVHGHLHTCVGEVRAAYRALKRIYI